MTKRPGRGWHCPQGGSHSAGRGAQGGCLEETLGDQARGLSRQECLWLGVFSREAAEAPGEQASPEERPLPQPQPQAGPHERKELPGCLGSVGRVLRPWLPSAGSQGPGDSMATLGLTRGPRVCSGTAAPPSCGAGWTGSSPGPVPARSQPLGGSAGPATSPWPGFASGLRSPGPTGRAHLMVPFVPTWSEWGPRPCSQE